MTFPSNWGSTAGTGSVNPSNNLGETLDAVLAANELRMEQRLSKYPILVVREAPIKRRLSQPRFRMEYDTGHDIRLRLLNTIVYFGADPYYIREMYEHKDDYWLIVSDEKGTCFRVPYKKTEAIDLRTPEPQYITFEGGASYLLRAPARQQQQGVSGHNTIIRRAGSHRGSGVHNTAEILRGLKNSDPLPWTPLYHDLMVKAGALPSLRLSPSIAFYTTDEGLFAEFRGRLLGTVQENSVVVDEKDAAQPWIRREIESIGCEVKKP